MYARAEAGEPMEPELSWEREPEEEFYVGRLNYAKGARLQY